MTIHKKILELIESEKESIWTAALGVVTKSGTRIVDVKVKHKIKKDGKTYEFPILEKVPVLFPRTSSFSIVSPLSVGDVVLCIFSKFNITGALGSSDVMLTKDSRRFSLNDIFCIPSFFLSSDELPSVSEGEAIIAHKTGSYFKFFGNGVIEIVHKSGSYIKFNDDGSITIYTTKLDVIEK